AQASASSRAQELVDQLTSRGSLVRVQAQAALDAADADTCRALGERLKEMPEHTAGRLIRHLSESPNDFVRASVLFGIESPNAMIAAQSLQALTSLEFTDIIKLRESADRVESTLLDRLVTGRRIIVAARQRLIDLCSQGDLEQTTYDSEGNEAKVIDVAAEHHVIALALLVDLYGGDGAFREFTEGLLDMLVGDEPPQDLMWLVEMTERAKTEARKAATRGVGEESAEPGENPEELKPLTPEDEQRWKSYNQMEDRRAQAQKVYQWLFLREPNGANLGYRDYAARKKAKETYWTWYVEQNNETFASWRRHLTWTMAKGQDSPDQKAKAFLLMNRLLGSISIPVSDEGEQELMPIAPGDTEIERITNLKSLEKSELRRRKLYLERVFNETCGATPVKDQPTGQ
ncbi:MAG: hypothetical protein L6Q71_11270, partial [Planctomycetes bacterium]|nr:hypothetical protein [Planctomycetota bacterium]